MITWTDEIAAQQRQQEMLDRALKEYDVSQVLAKDKKRTSLAARGLHILGERLVIAGVRLQLLNPHINSNPEVG